MDVELLSLSSMPSAGSVSQGPAKWRDKATESTRKLSTAACCEVLWGEPGEPRCARALAKCPKWQEKCRLPCSVPQGGSA